MEFELDPAVEIDPKRLQSGFTHRVATIAPLRTLGLLSSLTAGKQVISNPQLGTQDLGPASAAPTAAAKKGRPTDASHDPQGRRVGKLGTVWPGSRAGESHDPWKYWS
jgi:hypothetical protein